MVLFSLRQLHPTELPARPERENYRRVVWVVTCCFACSQVYFFPRATGGHLSIVHLTLTAALTLLQLHLAALLAKLQLLKCHTTVPVAICCYGPVHPSPLSRIQRGIVCLLTLAGRPRNTLSASLKKLEWTYELSIMYTENVISVLHINTICLCTINTSI